MVKITMKARPTDDWDGKRVQYDLENCLDIFARCEGGRSFDEVRARFDELLASGEVVDIDHF